MELGLARVCLAGDGLYGSGLFWGLEVASDGVSLVRTGVTSSGSAVVTPASVMSLGTASVDEGMWVVRASSSGNPAGETLVEGSSRSAREDGGPVVTLSVSSGLGFEVVPSGMVIGSSVEAGMVVA